MKRKNLARNALFTSIISLLLCVSMLVGTTFAWFTDSVVSGTNIIASGNLDVALYHSNKADKGEAVTSDTILFDDVKLWEPGAVAYENFVVANEGTLALKYQMTLNALNATETSEGKTLADVLQVAVVKDGFDGGREAAHALQNYTNLSSFTLDGKLEGDTKSETYGVVIYWKPDTDHTDSNGNYDNEFNVKGGLTIDLGISLFATQQMHEDDSFGSDYDEYATHDYEVSTLEDLKTAFAEGGSILLTDDIEFDKMTAIEPGVEVYLNLNGNEITVDESSASNTLFYIKDGAKLIIDGDGKIDMGALSTMAMFAPYGELVINSGTFVRDEITTITNKTTGLFMGAKTTASNVTINGGYFDSGYYNADAADIEELLAGTKTLEETADDIAKRDNSKDANKVRVALKDNVSALLNHSGYGSFKIYGGTFVGANPAWGDEGCMLPTTPNYLRPWSYYQGALLAGQTYNENGIVLPAGYSITHSTLSDGRPVYTVNYSK